MREVEARRPEVGRREHWLLFVGGLCLLCCALSVPGLVLLPRAGLPADYRATICLSLSRSPLSFSLWWYSPNLTGLAWQPLVVSNRVEACAFSLWSPWLPRRGGFDLRE